MRKSKFLLQITDASSYKTFRSGSLIYCLLEAYGIDEFIIKNCNGFQFVFDGKKCSSDSNYDSYFFKKVSEILTTKEFDRFKKGLRYALIS